MTIYIKNLGIIICCIYYFYKLLKISFAKPDIIKLTGCTLFFSLILTYADLFYPSYTTFLTIFLLFACFYFITRTPFHVSITATVLSFAFSYSFMTIASIITGFFIIPIVHNKSLLFPQIICCCIQTLLMGIPFKFKRLQNGMPFLKNTNYTIPGMFICLAFIISSVIINNEKYNIYYIFAVFIILLVTLLIYFYWRNSLTKTYMDKLKDRNILNLNQQIAQQSEEIIRLKEENEQLSKIVHKDNKLIPTLEHSVHTFIANNSITDQDILLEGNQIIERLSKLSKERRELIKEQNTLCQQLTLTNVLSIDQYLKYFQSEAIQNNIDFQTNIDCDVPYLIENIIEEYDLETLIQDLLDDAFHATQANNGCYILLSIGIISNIYTISIFDNGVPFATEVLCKWGLEQITTREDDGGSGIGMMNTYETLQKYNASFIIHELGTDSHTFTKEVTISFNNRNQYILQTDRSEEELTILAQRPDLQIVRQ